MRTVVRQVARGVWLATGDRRGWSTASAQPQDRATASGMPSWRAEEYLAGRALLRHLLATVVPKLAEATVGTTANGRPILPEHPESGVSISHDGEVVAAAVIPHGQVGVDVQLPPARVSDTLLRRSLHGHAPAVAALPEWQRAVELAWVWTVQEACVKAVGTGLAGAPWRIDVPPGRLRGHWGDFAWICLRDRSRTPLSCAFSRHGLDRKFPCG